MVINRLHKMSVGLALMVAGVASVYAAQTKSSFESGDFTGWNAQGAGWSVYSKAGSDGKKSAMCSVSKKEVPGLKACAKSISNANPGWIVQVDFDICGKAKSQSSRAKATVVCLDSTGKILQEVEKVIPIPPEDFQKISLPELIVPSGTAQTYLMLMVEVTQTAKANEWWRFDNVIINVK